MFSKIISLTFLLILITAPVFVLADVSGTSPGGVVTGQSPSGIQNPLKSNDLSQLLDNIINFLLTLAAPIAVIMMIYAGYLFITASDNEEKVKTARKTMLYVIIGVAILILSKGVVTLVKSFLEVK